MKTGSVKGTSDYLPNEVCLREFIQNSILETYKQNGFQRIMTPALEDIENLEKSDGGENLNLIFKIMKRGEKLDSAIQASKFNELADMGLRYDLTLPLSRYFANNKDRLVTPFKCIQIDKVYRAERPQKGRTRELIQCDIDIIGSNAITCEIELITVTAKALLAIGLKNFKIRMNDRRILQDLLLACGFKPDELQSVCVSFDKLDKIGVVGVTNDLMSKGFSGESIVSFASQLSKLPLTLDAIKPLSTQTETISSLEKIIAACACLSENKYTIEFDLSLVRGQGYYTGTVFEIESADFQSSIAGGGRYDNLIGKFTNQCIPAVGFSIGFERIYCILSENNFTIPDSRKKVAVLYTDDFVAAANQAERFRAEYDIALYEKPAKLGKFLNALQNNGYFGYYICNKSPGIEEFRWL